MFFLASLSLGVLAIWSFIKCFQTWWLFCDYHAVMSEPQPHLDVRLELDYQRGHCSDSVNIPLEELPQRTHELPAKGTHLRIGDVDAKRLQQAISWLKERGYAVEAVDLASEWHTSTQRQFDNCTGGTDVRSVNVPNAPIDARCCSKWADAHWQAGRPPHPDLSDVTVQQVTSSTHPTFHQPRLWQPSPFLVRAIEHLHQVDVNFKTNRGRGRVLDIACGSGRDMVWLAMQGYQVEGVDLLPDALAKAHDLAQRNHVTIQTRVQNVRRNLELPAQRYQLILMLRFMHQPLAPMIMAALQPGGVFIGEVFAPTQPTTYANLSPRKASTSPHRPTLAADDWPKLFAGLQPVLALSNPGSDGRTLSGWIGRKPL